MELTKAIDPVTPATTAVKIGGLEIGNERTAPRGGMMPTFKCSYVSKGQNPRVLHCEAKDSEDARKIAAQNFHVDASRLEVVEAPTEKVKKADDER
jgi:hypothetical protein